MTKVCVICGAQFDAVGRAKTCGKVCSKRLAAAGQLRLYYSDPRYKAMNDRSRAKAMAEREADPSKRAAYQAYHREWQRKRAAADPAYRKMKQASSARSRKKRLASDPTLRDRELEWFRNHHRRKQEAKALADLAKLAAALEAKL